MLTDLVDLILYGLVQVATAVSTNSHARSGRQHFTALLLILWLLHPLTTSSKVIAEPWGMGLV